MSSTPPPPPPPPPPGDDHGPPQNAGGSDAASDEGSPAEPSSTGASPGAGTGFPGGPSGLQRNTMALTALILGLIAFPGALILAVVPRVQLLVILTPVVAIVAIILGIMGIRRAKRPAISGGVGMSVTGIVLGAINLLLTAGLMVMAVTFLRACPLDMDASPEQATEQMLECMSEQGWLGPTQRDELEQQLDRQFNTP